ncbi:AraC family transcriptional regulator [Pedobacter borealis]|uniref:AraC family transcriptional regulator n=1 Tax=Pedobacter borealis TaxID=475254 RepID=UPI00068C5CD8|nr:AraC family transcriptional regulator [Pedobacter borealis]
MENINPEDDFFEKNQITVPKAVMQELVKNKFFKNALYITEIGFFINANNRYRLSESSCPDYVLVYCQNGKGHCETRNEIFPMEADQFMILSPTQFHSFQSDPNSLWSIQWLRFSGLMADELKNSLDLQQFEKPSPLFSSNQIPEAFQKIFSCLADGFALENIGYANLNLYHLITLLIFLNKESRNVKKDEDQLEQSISFMKENLHRSLTVESIAKEFNYSSSHYSTLFKQKTGLSPIDYFIRLKIQNACQLLTKSNLIVKEIAQKVGYDDPFYFSRMFKKIIGKSPIEYKERLEIERMQAVLGIQQFELAS